MKRANNVSQCLMILFATCGVCVAAMGQDLPPGGEMTWTIADPEEFVTFVLFDPNSKDIELPAGLQFMPASEVGMPEIVEYLKTHPDHSSWAFSFIEITREKAFVIDGKSPKLPQDGGIGLWFAPVDASGVRAEVDSTAFDRLIAPSLGAVLGLAIWVPDSAYVSYMRARGMHAEYGMVSLSKDSTGTWRGQINSSNFRVSSTATPQGEARVDSASGTQVLFTPGKSVDAAFVLAGSTAFHRECKAVWTKTGDHPIARGAILGPTYMTTYANPLKGSRYRLRGIGKQ